MPRGICSVVVVILLSAPAAVAQLPPEILVDQYLLEADQRMAQKDAAGAYEAIQRILALQEEHDLTLPEEFHFKSAQVAFAAGSFSSALESVNQYLVAAGRDGAFYQKALELLLATQASAERIPCAGQPKGAECWMELANHAGCYLWEPDFHPYKIATWTAECSGGLAQGTGTVRWVWDLDRKPQEESPPSEKAAPSPNESGPDRGPKVRTGSPSSFQNEPTCAGQPKGTACWMELSNQPGCYVWDGSLAVDATVIWTGECAEGMGEGTGTLNWVWDGGKKTSETTGRLQEGKRHGQWVLRESDGDVGEGPYVEGKWHGRWVIRYANGTVQEGPYVEGKMHGRWVERYADGRVDEGPYVEGKQQGQWVERYADGLVAEGPYVEGQRHGRWVLRFANGTVEDRFYLDGEYVGGTGEGAYVDGKMHGQWVIREKDGGVLEGSFVKGKRHGNWVIRYSFGAVSEGPYVEGVRHGQWVTQYSSKSVLNEFYVNGEEVGRSAEPKVMEGRLLNGTFDGQWVERDEHGDVWKGPYVDGKRHGQWVIREKDGAVEQGRYVKGKRHGQWVERREDNSMSQEGPYVDGQKHGDWVSYGSDGSLNSKGSYVEGKKHGRWVQSHGFGMQYGDLVFYKGEGPYVEGEKHGTWIVYLEGDKQGRTLGGGPYVKDKKHGRWVEHEDDGLITEGPYVEGKRDGTWIIYPQGTKEKTTIGIPIYDGNLVAIGPEMVAIPGGRFRMGCVSGRDCDGDEKPVHEVQVESFALSKYEGVPFTWTVY